MAKSESSEDTSRPWQSYHTAYTNAKAGMEGVNKEKVQRIVYEMSKGSKYFENEERKEADLKQKSEIMRARCAKLTADDISYYQKVADRRILELEATRDLTRIWLHVDMDAFYAAVETLSNPELKGKPMAVGGMSMISTANYEARKFGVRAAMPGFIARKLCPKLIFVPVNFKKYTYFSDLTRKVFRRYDPNFLAASLDEAYLDITNVCQERSVSSGDIAEELRKGVYEETGLTCSAGVGPNRLLAKVCSDINKPNGQFVLPNDRMAVMTFISSLPIRKIGGIGKVTEHILREVFEITTCDDMLKKGGFLCALFSQSSADFFLSVGLGLGRTDAPEVGLRKSISNERTFSATNQEPLFYRKLEELAEMLSADMEKEGLCGRTLTLKLKTASFEVRSRAVTLPNYISSSDDILKHALKLLKGELPISLRLIGLRMSHFNEEKDDGPPDPTQRTLSNYIISRESAGNSMNKLSSGSEHNDNNLVPKAEFGLLIDNHEIQHDYSRDILDNNEDLDTVASNGNKSDISEFVKNDRSLTSGPIHAVSTLDQAANMLEQGKFSWLEDYKCSVCGIELPPSFVAERQEHFDFHLAEGLQKEEEHSSLRNLAVNRRFNPKDQVASASSRKKHKLSPEGGKHLPIDAFFSKSNQNFQ